jgi:hypothetical protein
LLKILVVLVLAPLFYTATVVAELSTNRPLNKNILNNKKLDSNKKTLEIATITASRIVAKN